MKPNLKLHHRRDFVAIADHQSVRAAARSLDLAQPSVTRSLREFERELDASLVERHARGVVLKVGDIDSKRETLRMEQGTCRGCSWWSVISVANVPAPSARP